MFSDIDALKAFLDEKVVLYERPEFVAEDPISVPHRFTSKADIEIAGFLAATLAWGRRTTIINSCNKILNLMDNAPHQFITQHTDADLKPFLTFVHRTYNATDLLYFIYWLKQHFLAADSLEDAFVPTVNYNNANTREALLNFHKTFFEPEHPKRTVKHIATPARNSACKRLNMYLRWMVRNSTNGVDFGLWKKIDPSQLVCPLDVHVARVSYKLGLIPAEKADWNNAAALTAVLQTFDASDPVRYDFALFSLGAAERF